MWTLASILEVTGSGARDLSEDQSVTEKRRVRSLVVHSCSLRYMSERAKSFDFIEGNLGNNCNDVNESKGKPIDPDVLKVSIVDLIRQTIFHSIRVASPRNKMVVKVVMDDL